MTVFRRLLAHFTGYFLAWTVLMSVFAVMSMRIVTMDWRRSLMERLESEAVLMDEYLSSGYSFQDIAGLDRLCKSLDVPNRRRERVTFFNADGRIIADSRRGTPIRRSGVIGAVRPEVASALEKGIGREVRFSPGSRRKMAFVAYPHVHLGRVIGVIRLGVPVSWRDNLLLTIYLKIAAAGIFFALCIAILQGPVSRLMRRLSFLPG